jgi:nicotinate-nucleotide pyrophosphorylase (carboxylating)
MGTHNYLHQLSIKNRFYVKQLHDYFKWQLKNDLGEQNQDLTTEIIFGKSNPEVLAEIIAKEEGVLAGMEEAGYLLKNYKFFIKEFKKDGERVLNNDKILLIQGNIQNILKFERGILNLMQRMSGVATYTYSLVQQLSSSVLLCPTRKTYLGLMDKKAVAVGGGGTHRLGLYDAILVKENHLVKKSVLEVIDSIVNYQNKVSFVGIEVESISELKSVINEINKYQGRRIKWVLLLDNFNLVEIKEAVSLLKNKKIIIEVSGNITKNNFMRYAKLGVNIISMGELTHSVRALDFSLKIIG